MLKLLKKTTIALSLCLAGMAQADSILVYEKTGADGSKVTHTVSITGRWLRIDSDAQGKPDYTLMDTGRMIMFEVDDDARFYKLTRMGKFYWPAVPTPKFMPVPEKQTVSGVRCQKVHEMGAEKPLAEHCMSPGASLGLNARETKTLSRLFEVARRMGWDWVGIGTPDERQVSVQSRNLESGVSQQFKSVEHKAIPDNQVKIPDDYKQVRVELEKPHKQKASEPAAIPETETPLPKPESVTPEAKSESVTPEVQSESVTPPANLSTD